MNFDCTTSASRPSFRPGADVKPDAQTVPQGPDDVAAVAGSSATSRARSRSATRHRSRHVSRLPSTAVGASGAIYGQGTAIPHRADFNTLDNPFAWSAHPERDAMGDGAAGRRPLRRLQPVQRRLQPQPPGDGRRPAGRDEAAVRAARPRAGLQLDAANDTPAELPRPATATPLVPARRAAGVIRRAGRGMPRRSPGSSASRAPRRCRGYRCCTTPDDGLQHFRGRVETERGVRVRARRRGRGVRDPERRRLDGFYVAPEHQRPASAPRCSATSQEQRPERFGFWVFRDNERARALLRVARRAARSYETDGSKNEERTPDVRYEWRPLDA